MLTRIEWHSHLSLSIKQIIKTEQQTVEEENNEIRFRCETSVFFLALFKFLFENQCRISFFLSDDDDDDSNDKKETERKVKRNRIEKRERKCIRARYENSSSSDNVEYTREKTSKQEENHTCDTREHYGIVTRKENKQ